jgi:hypothetical protein
VSGFDSPRPTGTDSLKRDLPSPSDGGRERFSFFSARKRAISDHIERRDRLVRRSFRYKETQSEELPQEQPNEEEDPIAVIEERERLRRNSNWKRRMDIVPFKRD